MTEEEMKHYKQITLRAGEFGAGIPCFLCMKPVAAGETVFVVPVDCGETEKMRKGEAYEGNFAHRACVARVP